MADGEKTIRLLGETFPGAVLSTGSCRDQHWARIDLTRLQEIARWLRDDPENAYEILLDVTAVHWPDDPQPIELVYHLYSMKHDDRLRLKARASDRGPAPTLTGVWASANWNERETYDMFGIVFEGHPDLRRILMPDDYTDFPLRKEFPLYRG
jgi:NADH-quinone oxidoreductase subunit C